MLSRTGRIRQVLEGDKRIATVRANDGFLMVSIGAEPTVFLSGPFMGV
jgi:archaeosine-15-forming tRNA-guanine transglycosylase